MVAVEILGSVLEFAIDGFVRFFQDFGACRLCSLEMCFNIFNKNGKTLRSRTQLCGARGARARPMQHDPGVAQMHLRAADRPGGVAMAVMFDKAEGLA